MQICFYNINHIGDVYFSSLFINEICKCNKDINFLYYFIQGDFFFEGIPNIKRIDKLEILYKGELSNGSPPEDLLDKSILNILLHNNMQQTGGKIIKINNNDVLFINTWCVSLFLNHNDYDINSAIESYNNLILTVNNNFGTSLKLNKTYIPLTDYLCISQTKEYDRLEKTIFVFNYHPRSLNFDMNKLNNFISEQSKTTKIILSCYDIVFENNPNINFVDKDFHIYPIPSCKNLIDIWEIACKCKEVILLPTGSSWTFLHKLDNLKPQQLVMFNSSEYCNKLNKIINTICNMDKQLVCNITR
jgi:hypothetical protein